MPPTTRNSLRRHNEFLRTVKCVHCKKFDLEFDDRYENFAVEKECPCTILLCENCYKDFSEQEDENEDDYCLLDKHSSLENFQQLAKTEINSDDYAELQSTNPDLEDDDDVFKLDKNLNVFLQLKYETAGNVQKPTATLHLLDHPSGPILNKIPPPPSTNTKEKVARPTQTRHGRGSSFYRVIIRYFIFLSFTIGTAAGCYMYSDALCHYPCYYFGYCCKSPASERFTCVKPELDKNEVMTRLKSLENNFKKQPKDLWGIVRQAIKNEFWVTEPTTLMLVHNNNTPVNECFLEQIKKLSSYIVYHSLINRTSCEEIDTIQNKDRGIVLDMADEKFKKFSDPGQFMEEYKEPLKKEMLLIILNFHQAPLSVMRSFQHFSDIITPYVKGAFIILTLPINVDNTESERMIVKKAEEKIKELTKSLPDKLVDPLITRITEHVVLFENEGRGTCQLVH